MKQLLGRGAHGRVFEAEDTELRRTVALKVMAPAPPEAGPSEKRLREARSLARLSHPHVVEVFDTGLHDEQIWIAMELVRGMTLAQWAEQHPAGGRERFERVRTLVDEAAAGLAAAHERGLVHRDFKPANVLVGDDGRVRVADFGLARPGADHVDSLMSGLHDPSVSMTSIAGTPRYMSPEQLRGDPVDAASDQFGFAVTVWELAFGVHPFSGVSPFALAEDVELRPQRVEASEVPASFSRALLRALSPKPEDRFASMEDLRRALARRSSSARWWVLAGAVLATAAGLLSFASPGVTTAPCEDDSARARLGTVWTPERRRALQGSLERSDAEDAPEIARAVDRHVQQFAETWVEQDVANCQARWESHEIDDARFDARGACLREGLDTLAALLVRLEQPDSLMMARALGAVRSLPSPEQCAADSLPSTPDTPQQRSLRRRLAIVQADVAAGRYSSATATAEEIGTEAAEAQLGKLAADAFHTAGVAWGELNHPRRFAAFESAYYRAAELTDGRELARHANALAMQHAYAEGPDKAEEWLRHAEAGLRRHPDPDQELTGHYVRGLVQMRRGDRVGATKTFEDVLAQIDDDRPELDELTWLAGAALMLVRVAGPDADAALESVRRLDERTIATLGPSHPRRARIFMARARLARQSGDMDQALEHLRDAVRWSERGYGKVSPRTAVAYLTLGFNLHLLGDLTGAEQNYRKGLVAMGDAHDQFRVRLLRGLAKVCRDRGELACAEEHWQAAVSSGRRVWPNGELERARTEQELAEVVLERGRVGEAVRHLRSVVDNLGAKPATKDLARAVVLMEEAVERGAEVPELAELQKRAHSACAGTSSKWCERLSSHRSAPED